MLVKFKSSWKKTLVKFPSACLTLTPTLTLSLSLSVTLFLTKISKIRKIFLSWGNHSNVVQVVDDYLNTPISFYLLGGFQNYLGWEDTIFGCFQKRVAYPFFPPQKVLFTPFWTKRLNKKKFFFG